MFQVGEPLLCLERMLDLFVHTKCVECFGSENSYNRAKDILLFQVYVDQSFYLSLNVVNGLANMIGFKTRWEGDGLVKPLGGRIRFHGLGAPRC